MIIVIIQRGDTTTEILTINCRRTVSNMFGLSLMLVFFVMVIEVSIQLSALSGGCSLLLRLSVRNIYLLLYFLFGNTLFGCVLAELYCFH